MQDRFAKYTKLYIIIFLMFLSVPIFIALFIASFYGIFKILPGTYLDITFGLCLVTLPAALFSTVCYIFYKRTKIHPVSAVRVISKILFVLGIIAALFFLTLDVKTFFTKFSIDVTNYYCFSLAYMAGNVAMLFIIAIVQAFTTKKELDWMDKHR